MVAVTRFGYETDLTDIEWLLLEPLIPPAKSGGRRRDTDMREVMNGISIYSEWVVAGRCCRMTFRPIKLSTATLMTGASPVFSKR